MLETALQAAEAVLLDKRLFTMDDATYQRFVDRLDAPPPPTASCTARPYGKGSPAPAEELRAPERLIDSGESA